eukprot:gene12912-8769_t
MDIQSEYSHREAFVPKVSCCVCGIIIDSNPSNMCPSCLRSNVDITDAIQKEYILQYCPECGRYLQPPKYWLRAELESRELLTLCLKRLKGLNITSGSNSNFTKAKLVDAKFIWTEPHSKRIKLKLTVQKEVYNNIVIQQSCSIEYIVAWQLCPTCEKVATGQPQWDACVQLRQKAAHKKTFLFLEQLILKKRMHENFIRIEGQPEGLDFFFAHKSHALNFIEFLNKTAPVTRRDAVQLVSHDSKNNTAVQHYTFSLEISPLCREDLVLLPYKDYYLRTLGGLGPLVIVHKVYSSIVFLDPKTLRAGEITGSLYWKKPFQPLMNSREMVEFYVLECRLLPVTNGSHQQGLVTVCLSSEVGEGREWVVESHLGGILHPGDLVKGYFLDSHTFNNSDLDNCYKPEQIQDVVLVRKHFASQQRHRSRRKWMLKKLDVVTAQGDEMKIGRSAPLNNRRGGNVDRGDLDELEFEDEVERDKELRKDIDVYKALDRNDEDAAVEDEDEDEDDAPEIALDELLDELTLNDAETEQTPAEVDGDFDEGNEEDVGYKKMRVE